MIASAIRTDIVLQNSSFGIVGFPIVVWNLEKSKRITETNAATRFGREVFDKRQMIAKQAIAQIKTAQCNNMCVMFRAVSV